MGMGEGEIGMEKLIHCPANKVFGFGFLCDLHDVYKFNGIKDDCGRRRCGFEPCVLEDYATETEKGES